MNKADAARFFDHLAEAIPEPKGELDYINPYTLLVAVVLSAQATDVGVNRATEPLFKLVQTPEAMLKLGEARLKDYIKTIGLYNTKAKNVIALSRLLIADHGGVVPRERAVLETLPGVGRKTANVVLNMAFDRHIRCATDNRGWSSRDSRLRWDSRPHGHPPGWQEPFPAASNQHHTRQYW